MSKSSGLNGMASKSKAKNAYLRRHGVLYGRTAPRPVEVTLSRHHPVHERPALQISSVGTGLASISARLLDMAMQTHDHLGSIGLIELRKLQNGLLDEAEDFCVVGDWEAGLNVYTHALACGEKIAARVCERPDVANQAAILMHMGSCLHHVGELDAARAYYEQSVEALKDLKMPSAERWLVSAIGRVSGVAPRDVARERTLFLKGRLLDIELGRPPENEYANEIGLEGRWGSLEAKIRSHNRALARQEPEGSGYGVASSYGVASGFEPPEEHSWAQERWARQPYPEWERREHDAAVGATGEEGAEDEGVGSGARDSWDHGGMADSQTAWEGREEDSDPEML